MAYAVNEHRKKLTEQIKNGTVDWEKIRRDVARTYAKNLEKNLKLVEKYGKENNLSEEEIQSLREVQIIAARVGYLNERNQEAMKTYDVMAKREILANNAELEALEEQFIKRDEELGKHVENFSQYIDKERKKVGTNKR